MATSIGSQLQALRSLVQGESQPLKRPITRPSILFSPKEAADIDIDTIFNIALSGLEVLISFDEKFANYKNDLFSHKSKELDRELMRTEENNCINTSISSYLRILSAHFQLPASRRTLEYLIRRYKIHVYNVEDLILCALPYHDTHAFVQVVQLLNTGHRNSKWNFLDGVKVSGAPPPRSFIVQQCIRDLGVLETLCNYASPTKKFQTPRPLISFCTAVLIEVLGCVTTIESDIVKRILPFVVSGLQADTKGSLDHKAGSLMIVGLLANKVALSPKLVNSLIRMVAEVAKQDAKELADLQWFRSSLMALINLVQLQRVDLLPKKAMESLREIRDIDRILMDLCGEFNVDCFLAVLLESFIEYSSGDESGHVSLLSIIETIPMTNLVDRIVSKVLLRCKQLIGSDSSSTSFGSGNWAKNILDAVKKKYPSQLHAAFKRFLEDNKMKSKKDDMLFEFLCKMLDGNSDSLIATSHSKIWFTSHHPKPEVRCSALSCFNGSSTLKAGMLSPQMLVTVRDVILRHLHDNDLIVVQSVLSLDRLSDVINSSDLSKALHNVFKRCLPILMSGPSDDYSLASDVTHLCLKMAVCSFQNQIDYMKEVAPMIFPLLLVWPQTQRLNIKVLELAKGTRWPFFEHLPVVSRKELNKHHSIFLATVGWSRPSISLLQKSSQGRISSINMEIISSLVEAFLKDPADHIPWIVRSCCDFKLSKTLFFLILMQSLLMPGNGAKLAALFDVCLPFLKSEWISFGPIIRASLEKFSEEMLGWDCKKLLDQLFVIDIDTLNTYVLACVCWRLLETFVSATSLDFLMDECERGIARIQDFFVFLASSDLKHILKKHLEQLVENHLQTLIAKCKISPARFLSRFFTGEGVRSEVRVESLHCFAFLCSLPDERLAFELLAEFPSVLVPLSSDDQVVRAAAMDCIERQYKLWCQVDLSSKKNGNAANWSNFLGEFLGLIVQQKRLILSDKNFLASFLTCLLGSSSDDILMPPNFEQRFDQSMKEKMLSFLIGSALKLSDFGKLRVLSLLKRLGCAILHINDASSLLSLLLRKQSQYNLEKKSSQKLSEIEIKILCLLLGTSLIPSSLSGRHVSEEHVLKALQLGSMSPDEPTVVEPVVSVLHNLSSRFYGGLTAEIQDHLLQQLVLLFRNSNGDIQNSTRDTLLRLDITWSTFGRMIDLILKDEASLQRSTDGKKKKKHVEPDLHQSLTSDGQNILCFLSSLLDILQLKKNIANREYLIAPLFKLLGKVFSNEWVGTFFQDDKSTQTPAGISHTTSGETCFIQQTLLMILEDIFGQIMTATSPLKEEIMNKIDVKMVVECARSTVDPVTRNHIFAVLSSVAKLIPDKILDHMIDILTVLGESAVVQSDSYSQHVFEDLLSVTVPCWLSKTNDRGKLLKVFVNVLPEVAEHRRLSIFVSLLRILGESDSLAPLLGLLFQSLVSRKEMSCPDDKGTSDAFSYYGANKWECAFAAQICGQYSCIIWLPSLVTVIQLLSMGNLRQESLMELLIALEFISHILEDAEFGFQIDSVENSDSIQTALKELMEQVVVLSQIVEGNKKRKDFPLAIKKELKAYTDTVLRTIAFFMIPSTYFCAISHLLGHADAKVRKKALSMLCGTLKDYDCKNQGDKERKKVFPNSSSFSLHWDDAALDAFDKMCMKIIQLFDDSGEESNPSLKLAAVSTIELLAQRFPCDNSVFSLCLASVTGGISSLNLAVSSSCLRAVSSLLNVLGPRALKELPHLMENVIKKCWENSSSSKVNNESDDKTSILVSLLVTLEAVVDKLGGFLNPYLGDILEVMVLHPAYIAASDSKLKLKADVVRRLLTEKIPVRLILQPLLKIYHSAVQSGDMSLEIVFEVLADLVRKMDRSSISNHYKKIFDQCLVALDVRSQQLVTVQNVNAVEKSVINTIITLTMKLTESMFRPLFFKSIEWAETNVEDPPGRERTKIDRAITLYDLVYKLAESHRSLFVPYFKYLVKDCVKLLADPEDVETHKLIRKKKKAKIQDAETARNNVLSVKKWHLRALILSSLHKCFLHDGGGLKFLDSNFQVVVKAIVSQLVIEPPSSLDEHPDIPSVNEVDDLLVICIGQMAVTAGSDLLWKPLNHEVLLQTRSEKVRARILGLRIVKQFLEKLREEYLVLLPETIPFLSELLEDVELPVKSLAQDILKEMESMSGESLSSYL